MRQFNAITICLVVLMSIGFTQTEPEMGQIWHKNPENPTFTLPGAPGTWHTGELPGDYFNSSLVWDGSQYRLYVTGINNGGVRSIGFYTSDNPYGGWVEYESNPVFTAEDVGWVAQETCSPYVIWDGSIFKMWHSAMAADGLRSIGYATSDDGISWTSHPEPVLSPIPGHVWENEHIGIPIVFVEDDSNYFMYYNVTGMNQGYSVGCAYSTDGINWTRAFEEPILGHESWYQYWVIATHVVKFGDRYYMWFAGSNDGVHGDPGKVGVAVSEDGLNWRPDELYNPVIMDGPNGSWDDVYVGILSILPYEDHYRAVYAAFDWDLDSLRFGWASYRPTIIPPGDVSGTWTKAGSPIRVQGEITIPDGGTLTIEPGTTVEFLSHDPLQVQGQLLAVGLEDDQIRFLVDDTLNFHNDWSSEGVWGGIRFEDTPETNDSSLISFCDIAYAKTFGEPGGPYDMGVGGGGIYVESFSSLLIENNRVHNNKAIGIEYDRYGWGGGVTLTLNANPIIRNNIIEYNTARHLLRHNYGSGAGLMVFSYCNPTIDGNTIRYNRCTDASAGLGIWDLSYPIVTNNLIYGNVAKSFDEDSDAGAGGGVGVGWDANPIFINNTIAYNSANWTGGGFYTDEGSAVIINTIIAYNEDFAGNGLIGDEVGCAFPNGQTLKFHYSLVEGGLDSIYWYQGVVGEVESVENIFGDPHLWWNGILSPYSPCIGSAAESVRVDDVMYHAPSCDCDGEPRPLPAGSPPDMGAIEHALANPLSVDDFGMQPAACTLYQNYPNPFNPITNIRYTIPENSNVSLVVYNLMGGEVLELVNGIQDAGDCQISWNGVDQNGKLVETGVYFARLTAGSHSSVIKMVYLR